jgi:hypothetical protein
MVVLWVLVVVAASVVTPTRDYAMLDRASRVRPGEPDAAARERLSHAYAALGLRSFGARAGAALPLPLPAQLPPGELEELTGLAPKAFAPGKKRTQPGIKVAPLEAAAGLAVGSLLSVSGLLSDEVAALGVGSLASWASLRSLPAYELVVLSLAVLLSVTTLLATFDRLLLNDRLLAALVLLLPGRRHAVAQHEAGHFLCAVCLAVPVAACELNPVRTLLSDKYRHHRPSNCTSAVCHCRHHRPSNCTGRA